MPSRLLALGLLLCLPVASLFAQAYPETHAAPPPAIAAPPAAPPPAHDDHPPHTLMPRASHDALADKVDLSAFRKLAVFSAGRAKIVDTYAREQLQLIYGKSRWKDIDTNRQFDPVFTWLDLMLNKSYYAQRPTIYVEVLELRRSLVTLLPEKDQERWLKYGRLAPNLFLLPEAQQIVDASAADLRLNKARVQVLRAWRAFQASPQALSMLSPPASSDHWTMLGDHAPANNLLMQLAEHWYHGNASKVNQTLNELTVLLTNHNPASYPSMGLRKAEYLYNTTHRFTIGYIAYLIAFIILLIAMNTERRSLRRTGVAFLLIGFAIHCIGFAIRGILSGRWPIHNQYESFIALSWFAAFTGIILMYTKKQLLYGTAAAALGAATLLFANTVEIPSNELGQVPGILATSRILYIHVNIIIASYALIALGFFISLIYLGNYYLKGPNGAALRDLDRAQMVVLQLAFWLLGTGTLLGAYWADHAWGRWWAWDPKETWALITWIIYLIVIHVRFATKRPHLVTAQLSVVGFFVMLWTHWGVNMLLAGLHSYA